MSNIREYEAGFEEGKKVMKEHLITEVIEGLKDLKIQFYPSKLDNLIEKWEKKNK